MGSRVRASVRVSALIAGVTVSSHAVLKWDSTMVLFNSPTPGNLGRTKVGAVEE